MEAIVFTGIQAVGKSEFYKQKFIKTHIRLNMDMLKTRRRESILLAACLDAKQPFVIDNTNPTKTDRMKYINAAKNAKFKIIGYYFKSSIKSAMIHNEHRNGREKVSERALLGTYNKLQLPDIEEGYDELYYVEMDSKGGFIIKEYVNEI